MIYKNKTAVLAVVGAVVALGLGFLVFSNINTTVAFDGPPGSAGVGSGAFAVNATGSVAIATTTFSASKLRVAGSIQSTTGGFVFPDGTTQITSAVGLGGVTSTPAGYVRSGIFGSVYGDVGPYTFPASIVLSSTTASGDGVIYKDGDPFIHDFALPGTLGYNTFVGVNSGNFTMTGSVDGEGSFNTGVGQYTLTDNTTGDNNTAIGMGSLTANTTGDRNTAVGEGALASNSSGQFNTATGFRSLNSNNTGSYNTAYGYSAGYSLGFVLNAMTSSTFLGYGAISTSGGIDNSMALGAGARVTKSNQVVIGNAAVTETLLNGNVGIGTTAPTAKLQVNSTAIGQGIISVSSPASGFNQAMSTYQFYNSYSPWDAGWGTQVLAEITTLTGVNSHAMGNLSFSVKKTTADAAVTEIMRITNTGDVGIGTAAPTSQLQVSGSAGTVAPVRGGGTLYMYDTAGGVDNGGAIVFGAGTVDKTFAGIKGLLKSGSNNTLGDLAFYTRNTGLDVTLTERMRMTWDGKIGIGTTTPAEPLSVVGHIGTFRGSTPTLQTCGISPTITGTDTAGIINIASSITACTLKFGTAYTPNTPTCVFNSVTTTAITVGITKIGISAVSTTFAAMGNGAKINYHCFAL